MVFRCVLHRNTLRTIFLEARVTRAVAEGIVALLARHAVRVGRTGEIHVAPIGNAIILAFVGLLLVAQFTRAVIKVVVTVATGLARTAHRAHVVVHAPVHHTVFGKVQLLARRAVRNARLPDFGMTRIALAILKVIVAGATVTSISVRGAVIVRKAPRLDTVARSVQNLSNRADLGCQLTNVSVLGISGLADAVIETVITFTTSNAGRIGGALEVGTAPVLHAKTAGVQSCTGRTVCARQDASIATLVVPIIALAITERVVAELT